MENLQGKIIRGIQQCEDQDVPYLTYVLQDRGGNEIQIIDQDNFSDWFRNGWLQAYWIERSEVVSVECDPGIDLWNCIKKISGKII